MSSPVMSPQLPVWDESFFRDLMPASGDALVWPTRPAGRAGAATAAVLTVGALGGMAVIAQAIVAGSIPLPVALWPAPDAVPHPAVGSATGGDADLGHREGAIPDSPHIAGAEIVRDSDVHEADGATGHHTWQPPRVPRAQRVTSSDAGHHHVSGSVYGSQRMHERSLASRFDHRPARGAGWIGDHTAGDGTGGSADSGAGNNGGATSGGATGSGATASGAGNGSGAASGSEAANSPGATDGIGAGSSGATRGGRHHADRTTSPAADSAGGSGYRGIGRHSAGDSDTSTDDGGRGGRR